MGNGQPASFILLFFCIQCLVRLKTGSGQQEIKNVASSRYVDQPLWTTEEIQTKVIPLLYRALEDSSGNSRSSLALAEKTDDLLNFLSGHDGKDGPMKHIMRLLRILPPKEPLTYTETGQLQPYVPPIKEPKVDTPKGFHKVCPSGVEPWFNNGYYKYCDPKNITGCPLGFLCDYSSFITTHICCKDKNSLSATSTELLATPTPSSVNLSLSTFYPEIPSSSPRSLFTEFTNVPSTIFPDDKWPSTVDTSGPHSLASILTHLPNPDLTTFPNPDLFPFPMFTPKQTTPYQKIWETTDAELESQLTLFPGATQPFGGAGGLSSMLPFPTSFLGITSLEPSINGGGLLPTMCLEPPCFGSSQLEEVEVLPLTVGSVIALQNGDFEWATTVTLIRDGDKTILVDTGLPSDTNILIRELSRHGLRPDNVDAVVITHGHPDHVGNLNLFSRKSQLFSSYEFIGNRFSRTGLSDKQFRKFSSHVDIWKTPGHTPEDVSVIIRNVPSLGTVAVVGDLILNEDFILNPSQWSNSGSFDRTIQEQNIRLIVCMVDCVIPGHGAMFRVNDVHRKYANCAQRYESKYANYFG